MGILDDPVSGTADELKRQRILRANLESFAENRGISYQNAVEQFAETIDRSPWTVYMWMTEGRDGKGSQRPMPSKHFQRLVDAGLINPEMDRPAR